MLDLPQFLQAYLKIFIWYTRRWPVQARVYLTANELKEYLQRH